MEPDADFPAAHSMDTQWFAVDRDGHVGVFDSGEDGAVPIDAEWEHHLDLDVSMSVAGVLPATAPLFDLKEWIGHDGSLMQRHLVAGSHYDILMFLETLDPVRDLLGPGLIVAAPPVFGVALLAESVPYDVLRRIHQAGACRGCFRLSMDQDWPPRLGLFSYHHDDEIGLATVYRRGRRPTRPIRVDQLSPDLRAIFERMRFSSLCFAETAEIQPVDHAACASWGSAYLGLDGKTVRPVPGQEAAYREEYGLWVGADSEWIVEPPPE